MQPHSSHTHCLLPILSTILNNTLTTHQKIGIAIMQKLLPKLHEQAESCARCRKHWVRSALREMSESLRRYWAILAWTKMLPVYCTRFLLKKLHACTVVQLTTDL
jgi:hypothetical protein